MTNQISSSHFQQFKPVDKLVYIVTSDNRYGAFLAHQISHFGYFVQIVNDLQGLQNAIAEHISIAVVVDVPSLDTQPFDEDLFIKLKDGWQSNIPLMFVSDQDDQKARLNAIRANGIAFFQKPVDVVGLVDKLDNIQSDRNSEQHRILIVEDQHPVANFYQLVLIQSGFAVEVITDTSNFLQKTMDYRPDLILMDLYMPKVNGFELAKLLRQMDEFVSIPIVFLSNEDDFDRRMEAMHLGGDDFLIKPIRAAHLVESVKSRLERLRILRSYMVRDGLTGLINHTTFRSMLAQEVSRCRRQDRQLALAMIDLDHFKNINDTYGHAVGDSILKSLSRLLKERLRKSDIIGRYGGEEFVAILLDADEDQALSVMDEIRDHFSEIEHHPIQKGSIYVTFSCGIANFPNFPTAKSLSDAADRAMYDAKAAGRNRVIVANSTGEH